MLWNKRKPTPSPELVPASADRSGPRVADPDRALDAVGRLLRAYGRFAFDTERSAASITEQCERWAQRIVLGESRRDEAADPDSPRSQLRDWHGLQLFFDDQRQEESRYVTRSLRDLRAAVLELAHSLSGSIGEDQDSDARVEREVDELSRAVARGNPTEIARSAKAVIDSTRNAMARRRKREERHVQRLGKRLKDLRDELSENCSNAALDQLTGFFGRAGYEQQLDQLAGIGMLFDERPWLVSIEIDRDDSRDSTQADDACVLGVSKCLSRTFLRKQDFLARPESHELTALLVDMTEEQLVAALERLLQATRKINEGNRLAVTVHVGAARLRPNEDGARWRTRAEVARRRAREEGGNRYTLASV